MNTAMIIHKLAVAILPILFAITLHEAAHGYVAMKLGDKTALIMGRVTLNPIKHIDLIGTIVVPIITFALGGVIFGWAKPVPVTWQNLKHFRRDMALVSLAGPFANLIMAIGWGLIMKAAMLPMFIHSSSSAVQSAAAYFALAGQFGIVINVVLLVLNLLPIPPLDGSRVIMAILPRGKLLAGYARIEPYGIWILLALLVTGILSYIILPPISGILNWISYFI